MSLLSHNELVQLVADGVIVGVKPEAINATSIDIHLGDTIMLEPDLPRTIDYRKREPALEDSYTMIPEYGYVLEPGEFLLGQSEEMFNLPNNISAEYKLKSSMARIGLEHMNAGWCDAGWNGSVLTLEFKNMLRYSNVRIRPGDAIGQMIFFRHEPVGDEASYATRGRYNGDTTVKGIKI